MAQLQQRHDPPPASSSSSSNNILPSLLPPHPAASSGNNTSNMSSIGIMSSGNTNGGTNSSSSNSGTTLMGGGGGSGGGGNGGGGLGGLNLNMYNMGPNNNNNSGNNTSSLLLGGNGNNGIGGPLSSSNNNNGTTSTTTGNSGPTTAAPGSGGGSSGGGSGQGIDELLPLVLQLTNPEQREGVLLELSKKRESFSDLAPILWHTYGTVAALLQEIASIYPLLSPPTLTAHASNRVCNALALLQCVASHPDTRSLFLSAHIPMYLYPFLNTSSKSRPFEYLRLTSLGVIGALVKMDDADVINFLLQTEIIPLCLRIMETGSELSKTVATFIVQKILLDEIGLSYVCATAERFYAVSTVLNNMVGLLANNPSVRLLKHIVRCYLRLSDNARAREALRQCLPPSLRDDTFVGALRDDATVKKWLGQLLSAVGSGGGGSGNGGQQQQQGGNASNGGSTGGGQQGQLGPSLQLGQQGQAQAQQ